MIETGGGISISNAELDLANYHLQPMSPAKDAADPAASLVVDGDARPRAPRERWAPMQPDEIQNHGEEQSMQRQVVMLVAVLVAFGAPHGVAADPGAPRPILVLESHVGSRPAEVGRMIDAVDDLLETHGFAAHLPKIRWLAGPGVPHPGILDPDLTTAIIAQHLNEGWAEFVAARWDEATVKLTRALDDVYRNPQLVVDDTGNLERTFKALVALAVSHQRRAEPRSAARTMTEAIRIFPSRRVARVEAWGPEGEKLYSDMTTQVQRRGRGRLSIEARHPEAAIFVEGQLRGRGNAQLSDLVPGTYRVFIRLPGAVGHQYRIQVVPDDVAYLRVDPEIDTSLRVDDSWMGFQFTSEAARASEDKYAIEIARRWMGSGTVAVLATRQVQGRPVLEGVRYRDGLELRRAWIYTDSPDPDGMRQLVRFLADGTPGAGLEIDAAPAAPAAPVVARRRWRYVPQAVLGAGALALLGSSVWYHVQPDNHHVSLTYEDTKTPPIIAFVGSSAVVGAGVYLYLHESQTIDVMPAAMLGTGVAALLSGSMLYAIDEDPVTRPNVLVYPTYRNTGPLGLILGGTGIALTGAGVWLLGQEPRETAMPIVSVERGRGFIGWTGRF